MPLPSLILSLLVAAAQPAAPPPASPVETSHRFGRIFISPMGEPFHAERGGDALADWFRQADRNHDGQITSDELQGDAARFFALLDTNHDGEIDPDEITHYEDVVAPEIRTGAGAYLVMTASPDDGQAPSGGRGGHGKRGSHRGGGGSREAGLQGAERFGLLNLPEPVVSADTDFNRGVSLAEFRQAALLRFQALDVDRQGRLTLAVLESERPAAPTRDKPKTDNAEGVLDAPQ